MVCTEAGGAVDPTGRERMRDGFGLLTGGIAAPSALPSGHAPLVQAMDRAVPEATTGDAIAEVLPLRALDRCAGVIRGTMYVRTTWPMT